MVVGAGEEEGFAAASWAAWVLRTPRLMVPRGVDSVGGWYWRVSRERVFVRGGRCALEAWSTGVMAIVDYCVLVLMGCCVNWLMGPVDVRWVDEEKKREREREQKVELGTDI